MKVLLAMLAAGCLAAAPIQGAEQATPKAAAPKASAKARSFVPLDFNKVFSAGPLSDPQPPSTILPAGSTSLKLTLKAAKPTLCRYSVGHDTPLDQMTPFDSPQPSLTPTTVIRGLDPDPSKVNDVYIRCSAAPDPATVLHLQYRSLPAINPNFPRMANLWGSYHLLPKGAEYASRVDLWLGARFTAEQIRDLRRFNPNTLVLISINTVENNDVPDDYFLRDTTGRKIEVWPGAYRLNLTRPEVALYQARYAYQKMLERGLIYDGCFFDNFMMTQHWLTHDIYDRPVQLDADGDGKADDKETFDRAWREGVFRELKEWRKLMPWALTSGHSQGYPHPDVAEIFNGQGIGFFTTDVIEGKRPFYELWKYYQAWNTLAVKPPITSVESAVPDQIAYGYAYNPQRHTPPATWAFARDYYPYMRFGLAFTLMGDGYFSHEFGDTEHGQDWWYDELDFKLGPAKGAAQRIPIGKEEPRELLENGGFEEPLKDKWTLWSDRKAGAVANLDLDPKVKRAGKSAARITITGAGRKFGIELTQPNRALEAKKTYDVSFWAKADRPMEIQVIASKGSANWDNYGLDETVRLTTEWQKVTLTFGARRQASDARLQVLCGGVTGQFWLDDVSLKEHPEEIFRRDFQRGLVLLNPTRHRQAVQIEPGFVRLKGDQAPRYQYILDDGGNAGFAAKGNWQEIALGTKEWHAIPPYYHAWNNRCHTLTNAPGEATWDLDLRGAGTYTIQAWWAAAPQAKTWARQATYEVVAGGQVISSKTLDQSQTGDQWHTLAEGLKLEPGQKPFVRLRNADGTGVLVADGLHVFSAERYNDGSPATDITLEPMDGILLRKVE